MPIGDVLAFQLAHAKARDAVHTELDILLLQTLLPGAIAVHSAAVSRGIYLRRPDLGRQLHPNCAKSLSLGDYDLAFVIADGLSATAIMQNAVPMLTAAMTQLSDLKLAPVVIATQARVALAMISDRRSVPKSAQFLSASVPGSRWRRVSDLLDLRARQGVSGFGAQLHFQHPHEGRPIVRRRSRQPKMADPGSTAPQNHWCQFEGKCVRLRPSGFGVL